MPNSGKLLEGFVEQIERILIPQGITVSTNEKVFNGNGVQIAEFDIEINGKVGTTKFKWLIECRDRPSQGPAPGDWIEQLVGRRERFRFDKVIAVSTTGFSQGAEEYAEVSGIELRTVSDSGLPHISDWFLIDSITLMKRGGHLEHARLLVGEDESTEKKDALMEVLKCSDMKTPFLVSTESGERMTIAAAFQVSASSSGLYGKYLSKGGSKSIKLRAKYPRDDSHFIVETIEGPVRITEIIFKGKLSIKTEQIPIAAIRSYKSVTNAEEIAVATSFSFDVDGEEVEMSFNRVHDTGETHVLLSASKGKA